MKHVRDDKNDLDLYSIYTLSARSSPHFEVNQEIEAWARSKPLRYEYLDGLYYYIVLADRNDRAEMMLMFGEYITETRYDTINLSVLDFDRIDLSYKLDSSNSPVDQEIVDLFNQILQDETSKAKLEETENSSNNSGL